MDEAARSVDYRTSARPDLSVLLGRKPGPAVAMRRVVPGYLAGLGLIGAVLVTLAEKTPDSTAELVASSPLFTAVYTLSIVGLVGLVTLAFVGLTLLRRPAARLHVTTSTLCLAHHDGDLSAPLGAVRASPFELEAEGQTRRGVTIDFPSGKKVRVIASAAERVEHDDPWDFSIHEDDLVELEKRVARRA
jgi:hypothetical protein